ncbi:MAG: alpha/beta hydrolase [Bdellovibrionaceae bacterium]|nr:alpha/beta hydrolase [Pseudobdellovibrionaceae bacterium]
MKTQSNDLIGFSDFKIPILKIPPIQSIRNPYGEAIYYREFENPSDTLLVLVHGMGGDSRYLTQLGIQLASRTKFHVILPDLKHHGEMNNEKSAKLGPHEDVVLDLNFLKDNLLQRRGFSKVMLVGHSLGGAVVLKWLLSQPPNVFQKVVMISPYLPQPYSVESKNFPLWIKRTDDGRMKLKFPEQAKWGSEVEEYEASYIRSCLPEPLSWDSCLQRCSGITVIASDSDLILDIEKYRRHLANQNKIKFFEIPALSHIGLVTSGENGKKIFDLAFST